jgi:hypothetical protein
MPIVLLLCGLSAGGCVLGQPVEPLFDTVGSSYFCGRIQFTITSATTVTPDWPDRPCSGNPPLAILDAGTMGWDEAASRTLTIPLRIVNRGTEPVQLPIRLILAVNGKTVLNPFETPNSTMVPLNADSTRANGTKVWLVGGIGTVGPGDSTAIKTVLFQINTPVIQGRFAFTIAGETVDTARPPLPDTTAWPSIPLLVVPPYDTTLRYYRDVFGVAFDDTTSGAGVQQFFTNFSATIIGGAFHGLDNPEYVVRIPDPGNSWAAVDSIAAAMESWPGVEGARQLCRVCKISIRGRYPIEGSIAPLPAVWRDSTNALSWPWRSIRAPLAWGCETGTYDATRVELGIIDWIFLPTDISPDLSTSLSAGGGLRLPQTSEVYTDAVSLAKWNEFEAKQYHGQGSAGVMTATGDNGQGIAGMVWGSKLTAYAMSKPFYLPSDPLAVLERHLKDAANRGIRVVNLSLGIGSSADPKEVKKAREVIKKFLGGSPARLLVIATGNRGLPSTGGVPISRLGMANTTAEAFQATDRVAAELLGDPAYLGKILFVTGIDRTGARWSDSTGTANVFTEGDVVAAPAEGVTSTAGASGDGTAVFSGTSIAAPFVSGLAAQLWAMKPTLIAAQVKDYILRGAATSTSPQAQMVGFPSVFQIDAYNSLRLLSAENSGAPLCGNRIFLDSQNQIKVQRSGPSDLETISQGISPGDSIRVAYAYHGGRRVGIFTDGAANQILIFGSGSWSPAPWIAYPPSDLAGTWYSTRETSHDGDSLFTAVDVPTGTGSRVDVTKGTSSATGPVIGSIAITHLRQSGATTPTVRTAGFDSTGTFTGWSYSSDLDTSNYEAPEPWGGWGRLRAIPSPMSDRVLVLVNLTRFTFLGWSAPNEGWIPTSGSTVVDGHNTMEFRSAVYEAVSKTAQIYSMPWAGGTVGPPVKEVPDRTIEVMGISEDGSEVMVSLGRFGSATGASYPYADCEFQYWNAGGTYALKNTFPTASHVCRETNNAGSFSAVIAGSDQGAPWQPSPFMRREVPRSRVRFR